MLAGNLKACLQKSLHAFQVFVQSILFQTGNYHLFVHLMLKQLEALKTTIVIHVLSLVIQSIHPACKQVTFIKFWLHLIFLNLLCRIQTIIHVKKFQLPWCQQIKHLMITCIPGICRPWISFFKLSHVYDLSTNATISGSCSNESDAN